MHLEVTLIHILVIVIIVGLIFAPSIDPGTMRIIHVILVVLVLLWLFGPVPELRLR